MLVVMSKVVARVVLEVTSKFIPWVMDEVVFEVMSKAKARIMPKVMSKIDMPS